MSEKNINKKNDFIVIRVEKSFKENYLKYCSENCYDISKRLRYYIELDMKNHGKI